MNSQQWPGGLTGLSTARYRQLADAGDLTSWQAQQDGFTRLRDLADRLHRQCVAELADLRAACTGTAATALGAELAMLVDLLAGLRDSASANGEGTRALTDILARLRIDAGRLDAEDRDWQANIDNDDAETLNLMRESVRRELQATVLEAGGAIQHCAHSYLLPPPDLPIACRDPEPAGGSVAGCDHRPARDDTGREPVDLAAVPHAAALEAGEAAPAPGSAAGSASIDQPSLGGAPLPQLPPLPPKLAPPEPVTSRSPDRSSPTAKPGTRAGAADSRTTPIDDECDTAAPMNRAPEPAGDTYPPKAPPNRPEDGIPAEPETPPTAGARVPLPSQAAAPETETDTDPGSEPAVVELEVDVTIEMDGQRWELSDLQPGPRIPQQPDAYEPVDPSRRRLLRQWQRLDRKRRLDGEEPLN